MVIKLFHRHSLLVCIGLLAGVVALCMAVNFFGKKEDVPAQSPMGQSSHVSDLQETSSSSEIPVEPASKDEMRAVWVPYMSLDMSKEVDKSAQAFQKKFDAIVEEATITMPEMARLLGLTRSQVYQILRNPKYSHFFETIVIAEKKRITKENFQKFLEGQDQFHLDPANDYEELAQEQNIALANFRRKKLSQTGVRGSNGNLGYLTFDEASYLAKVSRSLINKWADKGKFKVIKVGGRVRISREDFEAWLEQRNLERSIQ